MKKRLSLLMALMMVLSLVPMSAFAAIIVTPDNTSVSTNVTYTLGSTALATGQTLTFELTNGAEFTTTPGVELINATGGTIGTIYYDPTNPSFFTVNTDATNLISAVSGEQIKIQVTMVVNFEDAKEGTDVKLDADFTSVLYAKQSVLVASVQEASSTDATITVTDSEKKIGQDGGKLSRFEIKNVDSATTTVSLRLPTGIVWTTGTTVVPYGGTAVIHSGLGTRDLTIGVVGANRIAITPEVLVTGNNVSNGSIEVNAKMYEGKPTIAEELDAVVGQLVDYEVTMTVVQKGKKAIESIYGGETSIVEVKISGVKGSLDTNRVIDFVVDGANVVMASTTGTDLKSSGNNGVATLSATNDAGFAKDGKFTATITNDAEVKFFIEVKADADANGTATIKASQRAWDYTADLVEVAPKFTVTTEITEIKKGESKATANIVITEAKAGLLNSGETISIDLDSKRGGVFYDDSMKIAGTNKMTLNGKKLSSDDKTLEFKINAESSKSPSVITISNIVIAVDGNAIDGTYEITANLKGDEVTTADYFHVVKEYSVNPTKTVFTIGNAKYTVDGTEKTLLAAPYIKEGRTMLPVRALAEALGLTVDYNNGQAVFSSPTKTASHIIGTDMMYVNGTPIKLNVASELHHDTTFVELRSLAAAFGVEIDYDATAKTVTVQG